MHEDRLEEAVGMLAHEAQHAGQMANGSSGHTLADHVSARQHTSSPRRKLPAMIERSWHWWNPRFESTALEAQYWKCSFPQMKNRFRMGLIYIGVSCFFWMIYLTIMGHSTAQLWGAAIALIVISVVIFLFTGHSILYQRFYLPTSFLCTFIICVATLLIFSNNSTSFMGPVASLATSMEVVLLIYTVIPLPIYICIVIGVAYSCIFELLCGRYRGSFSPVSLHVGMLALLHLGIHLLGLHLFILTQTRQRKTFLKVGQSLLARKDLELETQFKDHMIQSVMPKKGFHFDDFFRAFSPQHRTRMAAKVAEELLKETSELRRPSTSIDSNVRTSKSGPSGSRNNSANGGSADPAVGPNNSVPDVRKFRPFTMNLMTDVSILFADIAGFTKMSSNKSADELVNLLNDLFGRFDYLCGRCNLEKISTLGDCYYCVAGCPEPRPDHAKCCVEMGLAMIIAIRQFDLDRGQEVNMRVGIHTGKVMCGMVGTKRFKFDVFSNDVNLANEMESTGIAGRVHISEHTTSFLDNEYILEDGPEHAGMKTYFIAGRTKESDGPNPFGSLEAEQIPPHDVSAGSVVRQLSIRKVKNKICGKLASVPMTRSPGTSVASHHTIGGTGSLKIKVVSQKASPVGSSAGGVIFEQAKSSSMCAIPTSGSDHMKSASLQAIHGEVPPGQTGKNWTAAEKIGGKISIDLANGSSAGGSGRGSRSSGLQDASSDGHSVANLDTAISHHHNAASLTRFDTENRDFEGRLAQTIQTSDGTFARSFLMHQDSLNRWTLQFLEKVVEEEYRAHFAESMHSHNTATTPIKSTHLKPDMHTASELELSEFARRPRLRYSGVFIDILVAASIFIIVSAFMFTSIPVITTEYIIFSAIGGGILFISILLIGIPMLSRRSILPCMNIWLPRHILGCLLMCLPLGIALFNHPRCNLLSEPHKCISQDDVLYRLLYSYVLLVTIFAHCNFSQLSAWLKTLVVIVIGCIRVATTIYCQPPPELFVDERPLTCNQTTSYATWSSYGSLFFYHELIIDLVLAIILVAFLNYQFEAAFRMSFYGDVQARRDTQRMQLVRDQADWLLTNIIPQHAVESLKTNTKYSENHDTTAVLFASITNWNEMYEENFEGGREFLRVLNEVIGDFDELLDRPEFNQVEKIKTIGSTYMAASGLNPDKRKKAIHPNEHLYQLIEFALGLQEQLMLFNQDLLNFDFVCKLGFNVGPVTAGVIGTTKLYYDIWGDTVNIASRMYSTGVQNRIQVSQRTRDLLCDRYDFEYRDHIEVKGIDGGMDTYLLVGRKGEPPLNMASSGASPF
ncbi:hypothetical protein L596_018448 [Steinernema carpocapsae]|uniref:adenylate cyclase n=1 Tax=Steinernema carpocapsae TaxID=34508 RepID=A0A4U5N5P4_STECR|nr:hypothetical protein L596_018448 [Steinernema carpocapsae]